MAAGPPPPAVAWSRLDNTLLPTNHDLIGSALRLYGLSLDDSGGYLCTATNPLGTDEAITWLSVVGECGGGDSEGLPLVFDSCRSAHSDTAADGCVVSLPVTSS